MKILFRGEAYIIFRVSVPLLASHLQSVLTYKAVYKYGFLAGLPDLGYTAHIHMYVHVCTTYMYVATRCNTLISLINTHICADVCSTHADVCQISQICEIWHTCAQI